MILKKEKYPEKLKKWDFVPEQLFIRGNIDLLNKKTIGIIGSRKTCLYSLNKTYEIVEKLKKHDIVIVSGFAIGIDEAAHRAAILNNIPTIAVLGCGLGYNYPKNRSWMRKEIIKNGLFITSYEQNTAPKSWHFPIRNRLLSCICDSLIIIKCSIKSGTMITAKHALEQGKDIWVLPSNIGDFNSIGSNYLIYQGANILYDLSLLE